MAWIDTSPDGMTEALAGALREASRGYPAEYAPGHASHEHLPEAVRADSIVLSHARLPTVLRHIFAAYGAMLDPSLPLSRREHELIATTVSALNHCFY